MRKLQAMATANDMNTGSITTNGLWIYRAIKGGYPSYAWEVRKYKWDPVKQVWEFLHLYKPIH